MHSPGALLMSDGLGLGVSSPAPRSPHAATGDHGATALAALLSHSRSIGFPRYLERPFSARPPQTPRVAPRVLVLLASPRVTDFSTFGSLVAIEWITRPNRVCVRWAHTFAVRGGLPLRFRGSLPWSPGCSPGEVTRRLEARSYMPKELFTCLVPFSQVGSFRLWSHRKSKATDDGGEIPRQRMATRSRW